MIINETLRAYIAGFIDGEGCISASYKRSLHITAKVTIANTVKKILEMIQQNYKGSIARFQQRKHHQPYYVLSLYGEKAIYLLKDILPYLRIKNKQAKLLIDFYQQRKPSGGNKGIPKEEIEIRKYTIKQIKKLNYRNKEK